MTTNLIYPVNTTPPMDPTGDYRRVSRMTGLWYLGLAITGIVGFGVIRPKLYVTTDPAATLANLLAHGQLARVAVAVEMAIVATQAMTAAMFYRWLRRVNPVAAWSTGAFGMANALIVMLSAVCVSSAVEVSRNPALAPGGDAAATVQLLFKLSSGAWSIGGLFFGMWLIPIGYVAIRSALLPRVLGWLLIIGGAGYIVGAFLENALLDPPNALVNALLAPATIAELGTIVYLLLARAAPLPD